MVIEWLQFRVDEGAIDQFIECDRAIWTTALSQYPGFVKKEVWTSPTHANEVICVIHWQTMAQLKAIPASDLESIEATFKQAMDDGHPHDVGDAFQEASQDVSKTGTQCYELLEVRTYEQQPNGSA